MGYRKQMSYVEDTFNYEDWKVDNGDDMGYHLISIVNDFFKIEPWYTELEPLEYWIIDTICGATLYEGKDYTECVEWIKENYYNIYKIGNRE